MAGPNRFLPLMIAAWIASAASPVLAAKPMQSGSQRFLGRGYAAVRHELVRDGYKPLRLKHDDHDDCWYGARICRRYSETIVCGGSVPWWCTFIFRRPEADRSRGLSRYIVVTTEGEQDDPVVTKISSPTSEDMEALQARRSLAHYCERGLLGLSRTCPESEGHFANSSSEPNGRESRMTPPLPTLPPLPPSVH